MEKQIEYPCMKTELNQCQEQLADYQEKLDLLAYKSAHELRAPIARIKGLYNIFNNDPDPLNRDSAHQLLNVAISELDVEMKKISDYLNDCCN